ncbi:RHO1 GDP-GTP exchange protein 2 [Ceratocystis pirilliformis]|uniref:RHO1 GDP-GTP exchange protein 2 n=1 Tax=Ceratocystis pirilliformis TaxID=259994 RepID=A0ABR3YPN0_9PEZI
MSEYRPHDRGHQPPGRAPPPQQYQQRDAAFSNIFGAAPPPGRSHTMSSSVPPPNFGPADFHDPRRVPPPPIPQQYQQQQQQQSHQHHHQQQQQGHAPQQRPPDPPYPHRDQPLARGQQHPPHPQQQQRADSAGYHVPNPLAQYQHARRPVGPPPQGGYQQMGHSQQQRADPHAMPPSQVANSRTAAQRFHQGGGPAPAMNHDQYRTQSLASTARPQMYQQTPYGHQQSGPQHPQQPHQRPPQLQPTGYQHDGPQFQPFNANAAAQARTTAHGRVVPERNDERAMSMTGAYYPADRDSHQTMSGRVIPNRRPADAQPPQNYPSNGYNPPRSSYGKPSQPSHGSSNSGGGYSAPGTATRTASMASSVGDASARTFSMASSIAPTIVGSEQDSQVAYRSSTGKQTSENGERPQTAKVRPPIVYPALLSRVADCLRRRIITSERMKNGLSYKDAFSGADAVDVLSYIIRTTDRNLALLLGRALDAQKFFHDVTYEHRLRDSSNEMYQFKEVEGEEKSSVNGVFVLLSECYSPTCTRDQLCYSIACPRRLEQVSRLNLKIRPGLKKEQDNAVVEDDVDQTDEQKLWINSVPQEIVDSVGDRERKRQEIISELCYTERDFVKDLEYLRDFWIIPLRSRGSPIPAERRDAVVSNIFSNAIDHPSIHGVSSRFAKALTERQQKNPVVSNVGDIFLEFVPQFEPFIIYGSKQMEAKYYFEGEKSANANFCKFVDEIERRKESRKLELNGYLTKPTTRLARYPLLLDNVIKYTEDGNKDKEDLPKVLTYIRDLLSRVNAESGKAENRFNLRRLDEQLKFRPNERVDLRLREEGRELVFKCQLKKSPTDPSDINAFLFDHAVLLVKIKQVGKIEEYKAYRRPIPLELLSIREMEEVIPENNGTVKRSSSSILPALRNEGGGKKGEGWPITFRHLGKNGYELQLFASNQAARKKWLEFIDTSQVRLRGRADFFTETIISYNFFGVGNHVNCVTPFDGGRKLIYGTDNGIYMSDRKLKDAQPRRVLEAFSVTQIDVLEEYSMLLVLSNKSLVLYNLSALDPNEQAASRRPRKIQSHCNFFKTGICMGRHLVCCVKSSALSTTIKVYEPNDAASKGKKQKGLGKMFSAGQDDLKPFKEFYIPTESSSVHFLKSKLCVACARGFEVVDLETLETQSLLDQADTSLDFVSRKEGVRPTHIERLNGEFLLNYSDFSFFVNKHGWRARPDWKIDWEGMPTNFALSPPWILAFESNFIELRNIENGFVHIVPHKNIRMLHSSSHEILFAYEDERGYDVVDSLDFWKSNRRSELPPGGLGAIQAPPTASAPAAQGGAPQVPRLPKLDI